MRWARVAVSLLCCASLWFAAVEPSAAPRGSRERPRWLACDRWTDTATPSVRGDGTYFDVEVVDPWHAYALGARLTIRNQRLVPIAARWDGWRWTSMPAPRGGTEVTDMAAVSPTEIWAVGEHEVRIDGARAWRPAAWRFDGVRWSQAQVPSPGRGDGSFSGVAVIPGSRQLWAVGSHSASVGGWPSRPSPLAMRWTGRRWRRTTMPELRRAGTLEAIAASGRGSAWAVGTLMWRPQVDGGASLILRFSDGRWRAVRSPDIGVLGSVAATGPRDALAAGRGWGVLRWDGDLWSRVPDERIRGSARLEPTGVAYSTAGDAWIVGNILSRYRHGDPQTYTPVAYHRTSSGWARTSLRRFGSPSWVRAIDVATPHDVWAVGTLGVFGGSIQDPVDAWPIAQHWC